MPELIVIMMTRGDVRLADLPIRIHSRARVGSKLGARVVVEYFLMILYHLGGRLLPACAAMTNILLPKKDFTDLDQLLRRSENWLFGIASFNWGDLTACKR